MYLKSFIERLDEKQFFMGGIIKLLWSNDLKIIIHIISVYEFNISAVAVGAVEKWISRKNGRSFPVYGAGSDRGCICRGL